MSQQSVHEHLIRQIGCLKAPVACARLHDGLRCGIRMGGAWCGWVMLVVALGEERRPMEGVIG